MGIKGEIYAMTDVQRRRKKRLKRNIKRTLYSILVAPVGWPRLSNSMINMMMKICEISGILFVIALLSAMVSDGGASSTFCIISGIAFGISLVLIQIKIYQNNLEEHGYTVSDRVF